MQRRCRARDDAVGFRAKVIRVELDADGSLLLAVDVEVGADRGNCFRESG